MKLITYFVETHVYGIAIGALSVEPLCALICWIPAGASPYSGREGIVIKCHNSHISESGFELTYLINFAFQPTSLVQLVSGSRWSNTCPRKCTDNGLFTVFHRNFSCVRDGGLVKENGYQIVVNVVANSSFLRHKFDRALTRCSVHNILGASTCARKPNCFL